MLALASAGTVLLKSGLKISLLLRMVVQNAEERQRVGEQGQGPRTPAGLPCSPPKSRYSISVRVWKDPGQGELYPSWPLSGMGVPLLISSSPLLQSQWLFQLPGSGMMLASKDRKKNKHEGTSLCVLQMEMAQVWPSRPKRKQSMGGFNPVFGEDEKLVSA